MTTQAMECGDQLIELLTRQRALYGQLRDLTKRQTEMIDNTNPQMLLKILADRQRLIDKLTLISRELAPIRAQWNQISENLSDSQRDDVQRLIDETQDLLGEIMSRDREDVEKLGKSRNEVTREIRSVQVGRHVNNAYARNSRPVQPRSFDVAGQ